MTLADVEANPKLAEDFRVFKAMRTQSKQILFTQYMFKAITRQHFIEAKHHTIICDILDKVIKGDLTKVMINIAPRYGKTELAVKNFIARALAIASDAKFIHLSYSASLALSNSEAIKSIVLSDAYQELFPHVRLKHGSKSKSEWYTTDGGGVYATSTGGQITGFGAGRVEPEETEGEELTEAQESEQFVQKVDSWLTSIGINKGFGGAIVIDDPIKPEEADSELYRNKINERYDSTIKNRVNDRKTPIIIIGQRTHQNDLCGYLQENEPSQWHIVEIPCIQEDAEFGEVALWPKKHTLEELYRLKEENDTVFQRQYQQNPMPKSGYMYSLGFREYELIPNTEFRTRKNYTDTADTGKDYLCSINYEETESTIYITDIVYTQKAMETTETSVSNLLHKGKTDISFIESNNGGRGFGRNVETQLRALHNFNTVIYPFTQTGNKESRIFSNRTAVQNMIRFPHDWKQRGPEWILLRKHLDTLQAQGKDQKDDGADTLTGMVERFGQGVYNYLSVDNQNMM